MHRRVSSVLFDISIMTTRIKPIKDEAQTDVCKDPVRTAKWTRFISVIKTDQFMLYGAEVAVCSEINIKHISTVRAERTVVEC